MNRCQILLTVLLAALVLAGCEKNDEPEYEIPDVSGIEYINRCDFENVILKWHMNGSGSYTQTQNPLKEGADKTSQVGRVTTGDGEWDYIYSDPLPRKLDFTKNAPVFKLKVLAPKSGAKVTMRLKKTASSNSGAIDATVKTTVAGEWATLYFDFTDQNPQSNIYQVVALYFDGGNVSSGDQWYFDSLLCPDDDLTSICLFQRNPSNPVFNPDGSRSWRGSHMANAAILSPKNSPDGGWWLYLRGSGSCPQYCDQIGLYQQSADDFHPFGPWKEYKNNPVLPVGPSGSYDSGYLLDTAPVVGKDGVVYVYYNGQPADKSTHGLCVRYSTDGGYTFQHTDKPLIVGKGCSDAVYHDGKYYIFYGGGSPCRLYVSVTDDPLSLKNAVTSETIPIGGGPSNFDSYAVNGSMVFRLEGVDKWFCSYQGSSNVYDFPDRFHIAMSDDLIHWTKVKNDQPLFTRGSAGAWDQGAVWFCEIFEYQDRLYLYYEGWGRTGKVPNRDEAYFSGQSRVGAASCSKADFLKWCGLGK